MSFSEAISSVFSKYATFSGRARRSEYWYFCLLNLLVSAVLGWLGRRIGLFRTLLYIYEIAVFLPGLAVLWRRLHDVGRSGAYSLFILIPIIGAILLLVRLCSDSDRITNRYGKSPKYRQQNEDEYGNLFN